MNRPFIVAELSANHLGQLSRALRLIEAAADAGADAVKFQCYEPDQMADEETVIESGPWAGRNLRDLYRECHTPKAWLPGLFDLAKARGLVPFASAFHSDDVYFLLGCACPIFKISSFELTDLPLIAHAAHTGKPLILSTGMATKEEIQAAVDTFYRTPGNSKDLTLLFCTSAYPAPVEEANIARIAWTGNWFAYDDPDDSARAYVPDCGLSDHTPGIGVAVAATALGATVIEKHLTISRADGGPDAAFSMEPDEFRQLVTECRRAAAAIGEVRYGPTPSEAASVLLRRKPGGKRG